MGKVWEELEEEKEYIMYEKCLIKIKRFWDVSLFPEVFLGAVFLGDAREFVIEKA